MSKIASKESTNWIFYYSEMFKRQKHRKTVTKYEKNLKNFTDYRWKISKEVNKDLWLLCICPNGQNYSFYRVMIQLGMAKRAAEKN